MGGTGNLFVALFLAYYVQYFLSLISSRTRKDILRSNNKLDRLRKEPVKTVEQQKRFIDAKFPKTIGKSKFSWKTVPYVIWRILYFIGLFWVMNRLLSPLDISLAVGILSIMVLPIVFNIVLAKFGLQKSDLRNFLR